MSRAERTKKIRQSTLNRFVVVARGYGPRNGEQLLELVATLFADHERVTREPNEKARKFVESFAEEIKRIADAAPKKKSAQPARKKTDCVVPDAPWALDAARPVIDRPMPRAQVASCDPNSDAFLSSYEWRRVRMVALKRYGARCQCCGATPATGAVMNVDHIKPRKLFPQLALDIENLQVLCGDCNHGKGNWDMTDWRDRADAMP